MDPDTEDRVSRASQRLSCGSHYRDSMRMSNRQSFVQLVSDLRGNKKPEGEAMRYATRRRSRSTSDSELQSTCTTPTVRPPAAVLGALQELVAAICLHPDWQREEILQCLESACHGNPETQASPCIQRSDSKSKVVFVDASAESEQ